MFAMIKLVAYRWKKSLGLGELFAWANCMGCLERGSGYVGVGLPKIVNFVTGPVLESERLYRDQNYSQLRNPHMCGSFYCGRDVGLMFAGSFVEF